MANGLGSKIESWNDPAEGTIDISPVSFGELVDPTKRFSEQIHKSESTALELPTLALEVVGPAEKVNFCDRMTGPDRDAMGNKCLDFMLGDNRVFRIKESADQSTTTLENFDINGKAAGFQSQTKDADGSTLIRSKFHGLDGTGTVIIDRQGAEGKPEIKLDGKLVEDAETSKLLLQKEKDLFTLPQVRSTRDIKFPIQGGPPS